MIRLNCLWLNKIHKNDKLATKNANKKKIRKRKATIESKQNKTKIIVQEYTKNKKNSKTQYKRKELNIY